MRTNHPFVDVALQYADQGLYVLPLHTAVNGRCTCGRIGCKHIGKHPRTEHGKDDATIDRAQIVEWSELYPNANIGIATQQSGKVAWDIDARFGGLASLAEIEKIRGALPLTVEDRTGRNDGSGHMLFSMPSEQIEGATIAPGVQIIVDDYVVAPWSIHETGNPYTWKNRPGKTPFADLPGWVIERLIPRAIIAGALSKEKRDAGRDVQAMLRGAYVNKYPSRSEHEQAIISILVNKNWDLESIFGEFVKSAYAGSHFWQTYRKSETAARKWMATNYKSACELVALGDRADVRAARLFMHNLKTWAIGTEWKGRTGATDQRVLLAHLHLAEQAGKAKGYHASARDLASIAGRDKNTIERANGRLVKAGVIEYAEFFNPKYPTLAARFSLVGGAQCVHSLTGVEGVCMHYAPPQEDAFRVTQKVERREQRRSKRGRWVWVHYGPRQGLGNAAHQVFDLIESAPGLTIGQIARQTGRNRATVRRLLWGTRKNRQKSMFALGMVRPEIRGNGAVWFVCDKIDWTGIARELGTDGTTERQCKRYADEQRNNKARHARKTSHSENATLSRNGGAK